MPCGNRRGRPCCRRVVKGDLESRFFKPRGVPLEELEVVSLSFEELEAVRLSDYEDLSQEEAALRMGVSRRTFARDLFSGRRKIADALLNGKALSVSRASK
jgi:uncharacterized protein